MRKRLLAVISILLILAVLVGCKSTELPQGSGDINNNVQNGNKVVNIKNGDRIKLKVGDTIQLEILEKDLDVTWSASNDAVYLENCRFDGPADGESALKERRGVKVENCFFNLTWYLMAFLVLGISK